MRNNQRATITRLGCRIVGAAAALALFAAPAAAQQRINYTVYGGVAVDGYDTNIQIIGASVRPTGGGIRPTVGLQAYRLGFDPGGDAGSTDVYAVTPTVGVGYYTPEGLASVSVGYALVNDEAPLAFGGGTGESGFTTAVQGLYWGASPDVEAIAAYSWEPEYLWTNLILAQPIASLSGGTLSVGADGVYEGGMGDGGTTAYSIGPLVRWSNNRDLGVTLAGGYRDAETRNPTWFVRLGAAFYR
jgi:hypothetical protein